MKRLTTKLLVLLIALSTVVSSTALASTPVISESNGAIVPYASYYLSSYGATCDKSGRTVYVEYNVTATGVMDYVGAMGVYLYESSNGRNYSLVRTFYPSGNSDMLRENSQFCATSLTYNGVSGRYYYAVVSFYAENASGSDTKSYTTSTIRL